VARRTTIKPQTPSNNTKKINEEKKALGLTSVPSTYFLPSSDNPETKGLLGIGLLKPRVNTPDDFQPILTNKGTPSYSLSTVQTYIYFFVTYNNIFENRVDGKIYSFVVVKMLSGSTTKDVAVYLGLSVNAVTPLTLTQYQNDSFTHPKYVNQDGEPLSLRYAEVPILRQTTPGRLDNVPIGYPDFDSTPNTVLVRRGPYPQAPIVDFATATGATSSVTISAGGTVYFVDISVMSPPTIRPLSWSWNFGATASPTGSTAQNQIVSFSTPGSYTVTLTATNAGGTGSKTKTNFVNVI